MAMVRVARPAMLVALLLSSLVGHHARLVQRKDHAHDVKPEHKSQAKKLFVVPAVAGVFSLMGHVATVLSVADVASSLWDRFKPTDHFENEEVEEEYDEDGEEGRKHF